MQVKRTFKENGITLKEALSIYKENAIREVFKSIEDKIKKMEEMDED